MATAPDRRMRWTREALQDALLALMSEKGYEAVTVQDIIERADVARSTFYTHYTDKDDLFQDGLAGPRSIVEKQATTAPAGRRLLSFSLLLFRHVDEQRRLARVVFSQPRRTPILQQIDSLLAGIFRTELATLDPANDPRPIPHEALDAPAQLPQPAVSVRPRLRLRNGPQLYGMRQRAERLPRPTGPRLGRGSP